MKLMFVSDIHGDIKYTKEMKKIYMKEKPYKLILLGDLLYNKSIIPFAKGNERIKVAGILNDLADNIIAVKGNCDTDLDEELLYFKLNKDYQKLDVDNNEFFITHGHIYNRQHLPPSNTKKIILIHGHTHIPCIENTKEYLYLNPGSISVPREENPHTYMVYENKEFVIKDINGKEINSIKIV